MSDGSLKLVLQYVKNTGGGATQANFVEDHEPVGDFLWKRYSIEKGYIAIVHGRIVLTQAGEEALRTA